MLAMLTTMYNSCGGVIYLTKEDEKVVKEETFQLFKERVFRMIIKKAGLSSGDLFSFTEVYLKFKSQASWAAVILSSAAKGDQCSVQADFRLDADGEIHPIKQKKDQVATLSPTQQISAGGAGASAGHHQKRPSVPLPRQADASLPDDVPAIGDSETENMTLDSSSQDQTEESLSEDVPATESSDTHSVVAYSSFQRLDWTNNKKDWQKYVKTKEVETNEILTTCNMLQPAVPMTVTPEKNHLQYMFQSVSDMERVLATCQIDSSIPQFAIACKSWRPIVSKSKTDQRPVGHICDILTVSADGRIKFWVIVDDSEKDTKLQTKEYLMTTGRMIKYHLVRHWSQGVPHVFVQCGLASVSAMTQMQLEVESSKMQEHLHDFYYFNNDIDFTTLQRALAGVILSRESPLTRCASEQTSILFSAKQAKAQLNSAKVNYTSGPAGCGKSWIAAEIYRQHGAEKSVYICTTEPFRDFLRFNGYRGTLIQHDHDLINEILEGNFNNKTCIIIDDSHNFLCAKSSMKELFKMLKKKREMVLFVFADNDYQAFDRKRQLAMYDYVHELTRHVLDQHLNSPYLTEVYRNTRKVVSFIQSAVEDVTQSYNKIECAHIDNGDGIECIKITNIFANTSENDLVKYLHSLLPVYEPSSIAVFLDNSQPVAKVSQYRSLLKELMPKTIFQSADGFPRTGIIVDSVDSFLGLDAAVCIFILSSTSREMEPEQSLSNPRYRVFLASRATHKAVFVVPEIDADLVERMKFDQFYVSIS